GHERAVLIRTRPALVGLAQGEGALFGRRRPGGVQNEHRLDAGAVDTRKRPLVLNHLRLLGLGGEEDETKRGRNTGHAFDEGAGGGRGISAGGRRVFGGGRPESGHSCSRVGRFGGLPSVAGFFARVDGASALAGHALDTRTRPHGGSTRYRGRRRERGGA